jgi:hypothetical protein
MREELRSVLPPIVQAVNIRDRQLRLLLLGDFDGRPPGKATVIDRGR